MKAKYSLSQSVSSFSFSRSGTIVKSIRTRPRLWITSIFVASCLFIWVSLFLLAYNTRERTRIVKPAEYLTPIPQDQLLDRWLPKVNAVILILCRNQEMDAIIQTLTGFESRFNKKYAYPYVFLNNEAFTSEFKTKISTLISKRSGASVEFGQVPSEHWQYPPWIDQEQARTSMREMERRGVMSWRMESYRFMCRYYSGFFYRHPLLQRYEYYWRVEPGVEFLCDINYDIFRFMQRAGKRYGFVMMMNEIRETIPTLWKTVMEDFLPKQPRLIVDPFDSKVLQYFASPHHYTGCHFWDNFEIASFDLYRSAEYQRYFEVLDRKGGFFYERWGDAPVHSIAAGLFLKPEQIHYFHDIGYRHHPFSHCPADFRFREEAHCSCDPFDPSDASMTPCLTRWTLNFSPLF